MNSCHVNDVLDHVVKRLDQTQNLQITLDRVMERLDTVQNFLERQNMKQNSLDLKLSEIMTKLEKEKIFMRDQLKEAQDDILTRLRDLQSQKKGDFLASPPSKPGAGQALHQLTQSTPGWSDVINEFKDKLGRLDQKTDLMSTQIIETTQTCHNLVRSTRKIETQLEEKLTGQDQENVKTCLAEILSVPDVVRGQTRAELVWLSDHIDNKLSDIVGQQQKQVELQVQQNRAGIDLESKMDKLYKSTLDMETQLQSISGLVVERSDGLNRELGRCIETVIRATDTAKDDLLKDLTNSDVTQTQDWRKLQGEMEQINTSITSLAEHLNTVEKSMAKVVQKIDSVNDGHNEMKDDIYRSKRETSAVCVSEKEAQIVRDRIEGPLPSLGKHSFDFYVRDFKNLIRSGEHVHSQLWYIKEAGTCVWGSVGLTVDGVIHVRFGHGSHPQEVGLQPRPARGLKVKATICDLNKVLPDIVVGEVTMHKDEQFICRYGDWGWSLGVMSCDELINKGYGWKERYGWEALLIRYDVTVL